jgi:hypothetical protein
MAEIVQPKLTDEEVQAALETGPLSHGLESSWLDDPNLTSDEAIAAAMDDWKRPESIAPRTAEIPVITAADLYDEPELPEGKPTPLLETGPTSREIEDAVYRSDYDDFSQPDAAVSDDDEALIDRAFNVSPIAPPESAPEPELPVRRGRHAAEFHESEDPREDLNELARLTVKLVGENLAAANGTQRDSETQKTYEADDARLVQLFKRCEEAGASAETLRFAAEMLDQSANHRASKPNGAHVQVGDLQGVNSISELVDFNLQNQGASDQPEIDPDSPITFATAAGEIQQTPTRSIDITHALQDAQSDKPAINEAPFDIVPEAATAENPGLAPGAFMKSIQKYPEGEYAVAPTPQNEHWPRVQYEGKWYLPSELPQTDGPPLEKWVADQTEVHEASHNRKGLLAAAKDIFRPIKWGAEGLWDRVQKIGKKAEDGNAVRTETMENDEKTASRRRVKFVLGAVGSLALAGLLPNVGAALDNGSQAPSGNHAVEQPNPYGHHDILSFATPTPTPSASEQAAAQPEMPKDAIVGAIHTSSHTIEQPTTTHIATPAADRVQNNALRQHEAENTVESLVRSHDIMINHNDGGDVLIDKFNAAFGTHLQYGDWTEFAGKLSDTYSVTGQGGRTSYGLNYTGGPLGSSDKQTIYQWAQQHGRV